MRNAFNNIRYRIRELEHSGQLQTSDIIVLELDQQGKIPFEGQTFDDLEAVEAYLTSQDRGNSTIIFNDIPQPASEEK